MDYRVASNIRGKSLSSLMADKITSGKGVGSALGGAISDKFKARATGVKEKFDPMNIAKFMTGGSRLGPAIMGRLTGRSQSDINYFAGDKQKKGRYTQIPTSMATPGEGLGGSAVEVLNKMLAFMMNSREKDLKKRETAKQFIEEQKVEEQRRQNEFLKLLREYTSLSETTTLVRKEEEDGGGLFDLFKNSKKLLSLARLLVPFLINPLTLTLGAVLAAAYGLQKIADFVPNGRILTPLQAQAALGGSEYDIKGLGGYDFLAKRITEGPEEAQKALDDFAEGKLSYKELQNLGGESKLKEIASQKGLEVPEQKQSQTTNNVPPRPTGTGLKPELKRKQWDEKYGENYNFDGTPKVTQVPSTGTTPTPAASPEGTPAPVPTATPMGGEGTQTPPAVNNGANLQPVQQMPMSARMNNAVDENQNLNLESYNSGSSGSVAPVISSSSNSVDLPDRPIPATATVRDKTPILDHVLQQSLAPV
jgi:hypothetical protein